MMYAMRKDRIMGDTRRRSRAVMSGADRRSSQRSGQPRRRPEQRNQMGDDRDKTQRQRSAQRKRPSGSTSANGRRSANGRPSQKGRSRKRAKRGFASWSTGKKAVAILMGVLILLITATVAVVAAKWGKIGGVALNPDKLAISEEAEISGTGYLTVALFGLDTRETDEEMGSRSDTIMVASLNRETKEIKLVSVYRDTLLQLSDGTYNKANAAYAYGGEEEAVAMLNKNLDLNIEHYVSVDFSVLVHVIDALGGIDINVEEAENGMDIIPYLNNYVVEVIKNTGVDSAPFTQLGQQHLNGVQATAYARLRYGGGDDYKRTERQRQVLEQIAIKAQKAKLSTINKIIDKVFDNVKTNFTLTETIAYAKDVKSYKFGETQGFPYESTTADLDVGNSVVATDLASDVTKLHQFLFGENDYTPSSTVQSISEDISNSTYYTGESYDTEYDEYGYSQDYSGYDSGYTDNSYGTGGYQDSGYGDGSSGNGYTEDTGGDYVPPSDGGGTDSGSSDSNSQIPDTGTGDSGDTGGESLE